MQELTVSSRQFSGIHSPLYCYVLFSLDPPSRPMMHAKRKRKEKTHAVNLNAVVGFLCT